MSFMKKMFGKDRDEEPAPPPPEPEPVAQPEPEPEPIPINEISPEDLKARLDNGDDLVVVDRRQSWEYQAGHIPGALHLFINEIPVRFNELPKDKDVIFQCWHGNTSLQAAYFMMQQGWDGDHIYSLSGGIAGWGEAFGPEGMVKD